MANPEWRFVDEEEIKTPTQDWKFVEEEEPEDFSDIQKRYKESYNFKFGEAAQAAEKRKDIYKEAEQLAKRKLGFEDKKPSFDEQKQVRAEVDRILGRESIGGGGVIPLTTQEVADMPEATKYTGRGIASGATIGLSKWLEDGEVPEKFKKNYLSGEIFGSLLPIEALYSVTARPLVELAKKSPILTRQLQALARITGSGLAGATYKGAEDAFQGKMPSQEDLLVHGTEWALLDAALMAAGSAGRFARSLMSKAKSTGKPSWEITNEIIQKLKDEGVEISTNEAVGAKALSILEKDTPEAFEGAKKLSERKVEPKILDELHAETELPKEMERPEVKTFEELQSKLDNPIGKEELNTIAETPKTEQSTGQLFKDYLENQKLEARDFYKPLYEEARAAAREIKPYVNDIADTIKERLESLDRLKTKPSGYTKTINDLEAAMQDIGVGVIRDSKNNRVYVEFGGASTSDLMELKRRINEIVDFTEPLEPSVKQALNDVNKEVRAAIKDSLSVDAPDAFKAFEQAEKKYAETAQKFSRDNIRKFRKTQQVEKIPSTVHKPTVFDDLKSIMSKDQMMSVERQALENINKMKYEEAKRAFQELEAKLSPKSRDLGKRIIQKKGPKTLSRNQELEKWVIDKMNQPKPSRDLINMWKDKAGNAHIRRAMLKNPNKNNIFKYLERQSFKDFSQKIVSADGKVNFKELDKFLKDTNNVKLIREIGGQEAVNFFKDLKNLSNNFEQNVKRLEKLPDVTRKAPRGKRLLEKAAERRHPMKAKFNKALESLGVDSKKALYALAFLTGAVPGGLFKVAGPTATATILYKVANKPRVIRALKEAGKPNASAAKLIYAIETLDKALKE